MDKTKYCKKMNYAKKWMIPNWGSNKELQLIGLQVWYFVPGASQCGGPQGIEKTNMWKKQTTNRRNIRKLYARTWMIQKWNPKCPNPLHFNAKSCDPGIDPTHVNSRLEITILPIQITSNYLINHWNIKLNDYLTNLIKQIIGYFINYFMNSLYNYYLFNLQSISFQFFSFRFNSKQRKQPGHFCVQASHENKNGIRMASPRDNQYNRDNVRAQKSLEVIHIKRASHVSTCP